MVYACCAHFSNNRKIVSLGVKVMQQLLRLQQLSLEDALSKESARLHAANKLQS